MTGDEPPRWSGEGGYTLVGDDGLAVPPPSPPPTPVLRTRGRNLRLLSRAGGVAGALRDEAEGVGVIRGVWAPPGSCENERLWRGEPTTALR